MPDLETIVQRMMDANESEDDIEAVIKEFNTVHPPKPQPVPRSVQQTAPTEEDTFMGGFTKSLFGGEALSAGLQGAGGFLRGAIADIPSTLWGGAKDIFESASDPSKFVRDIPGAITEGVPAMAREMGDVTARAGSDPHAFGRMMGQLTGQPAVMGKLPALRNPTANVLEGTGRFVAKNQPVTGMLPRIAQPRTMRLAERGAGKLAERLGQAIRKEPEPLPYGEVDLETPVNTVPVKPAPAKTPSRFQSKPYEPSERPTPEGRLSKSKVPTPEEEMAAAIQEVRDQFAQQGDPTTQLPPPDYSLGARSAPEQPRIDVRAPKSRFKKEAKAPKEAPPKEEFKPSNDPKEVVNTETGEVVDDVAEAFNAGETGTALPDEVKALIREKVRGKKSKGNWSINLKDKINNFMKEESGQFDPDFWRREAEPFDVGSIDEPIDLTKAVQSLEAAPISNRQMFELSAQRGAEEAAARRPQSAFTNAPGLHEFQPDMMFLPDEFAQADIPPMQSPVENRFDPRVAPGGNPSDIFEGASPTFQNIEKRMYELTDKGTAGTLTGEELAEAQALNKVWRDHPFFSDERGMVGKNIPSQSAFKRQLNEKFAKESAPGVSGAPRQSEKIHDPSRESRSPEAEANLNTAVTKAGEVLNTQPRLRKKTGEIITPKSKPIGEKGKAFRVVAPDGKHLGDIDVVQKDIEGIIKAAGLEMDDATAKAIGKEIYDNKLDELLEEHGYSPDDLPRMAIEEMDNRTKRTPSTTPEPKEPTVETNKPEKLDIDPDAAFGHGGDIGPIREAAARLERGEGGDLRFKPLLPKSMQYALGEGESFKRRLQDLLEATRERTPTEEAAMLKQIQERDAFLESVRQAGGKEILPNLPPLRGNENLPPLRIKDLNLSRTGNIRPKRR